MQSGFLDTVSGNELWGGLINLSLYRKHRKDCFPEWWMNRCPVCRCVTGWKDWKHSSVRLQMIGNGALKNHVNSSLISALRGRKLPALLDTGETGPSNWANMSDTARADVMSTAISHWLTHWLQSERHLFIFIQSTSGLFFLNAV